MTILEHFCLMQKTVTVLIFKYTKYNLLGGYCILSKDVLINLKVRVAERDKETGGCFHPLIVLSDDHSRQGRLRLISRDQSFLLIEPPHRSCFKLDKQNLQLDYLQNRDCFKKNLQLFEFPGNIFLTQYNMCSNNYAIENREDLEKQVKMNCKQLRKKNQYL